MTTSWAWWDTFNLRKSPKPFSFSYNLKNINVSSFKTTYLLEFDPGFGQNFIILLEIEAYFAFVKSQ
jgi:hypothetical protein